MQHAGKAKHAALRLIAWGLVAVDLLLLGGAIAVWAGPLAVTAVAVLGALWVLFAGFSFYFFRDPEPRVPREPGLVVSPAHGKVDAVEEAEEPLYLEGKCRRISIFLSVLDVHVQNAPVRCRVQLCRHSPGQFLNALKADSARYNENVFLGLESLEGNGQRLALRLIAGLIARRIVPWVQAGDQPDRGERISLIQFGSRVDLYLPLEARVAVQPGDRVVGGETVVGRFE